MISSEPIACGFYRLKHLPGLSYICTLAKYDFNFKQCLKLNAFTCIKDKYETYLSHIYHLYNQDKYNIRFVLYLS